MSLSVLPPATLATLGEPAPSTSSPQLARVANPHVRPPALSGQPLAPEAYALPLPPPPAGLVSGPARVQLPVGAHPLPLPRPAPPFQGSAHPFPMPPQARPGEAPASARPGRPLPLPSLPEHPATTFLRKVAERHRCTLGVPFNQMDTKRSVFQEISRLDEHIPLHQQARGACYGLSLNWLKNAAQGKADDQFVDSFKDWKNDSTFLRTMGLQYIEQVKDANESDFIALQRLLPMVGFRPPSFDRGGKMDCRSYPEFARMLSGLLVAPGEQYILLLTDTHAMALRKDRTGQVHFFEPNMGIAACDRVRPMMGLIHQVLNESPNYWKHENRSLLVCEVQPAPVSRAGAAGAGTSGLS